MKALPIIWPQASDIGKIAFMKSKGFPYVTFSTIMQWKGHIVTHDKKYNLEIFAIMEKEQAQPFIDQISTLKKERVKKLQEVKDNFEWYGDLLLSHVASHLMEEITIE